MRTTDRVMAHARPEVDLNPDDDLVCQTLKTGRKIPKLGYWTALAPNGGRDLERALDAGYRHVTINMSTDSDDVTIGKIINSRIQRGNLERDELFMSVIFDLSQQRPLNSASTDILGRLKSINCGHLDMIILHKSDTNSVSDSLRQRNTLLSTWKSLEKLLPTRHARGLSLSNFRRGEVDFLLASTQTKPEVLWFLDPPVTLGWASLKLARGYCLYNKIKMGVLSTVDRPEADWVRSICPSLAVVAKRSGHTPIQVFQRYHVQKNVLMSLAVENRIIEPSFQILDFFLEKDDIDELQLLPV